MSGSGIVTHQSPQHGRLSEWLLEQFAKLSTLKYRSKGSSPLSTANNGSEGEVHEPVTCKVTLNQLKSDQVLQIKMLVCQKGYRVSFTQRNIQVRVLSQAPDLTVV